MHFFLGALRVKTLGPGLFTACTKPISPSARVEDVSVKTGLPAFKAAVKLGHFSDSAPCNVQNQASS